VEARQAGTLTDRLAIAGGRLREAAGAPQSIGQMDEGTEAAGIVTMGLGQRARRLIEAALGEKERAEPFVGDGVARLSRKSGPECRFRLEGPPTPRQGLPEARVGIREGGRQRHGEAERGFGVGLLTETPTHDPEAKMGERVARLEPRGLAIGVSRVLPLSLPLESQTEPEVGFDGSRGELEGAPERDDGLAPAPLLEEDGAQVEVRGRRAGPRLHHLANLRLRFLRPLLATKRGGEERTELRVARGRGQRAPAHRLRLNRTPVGKRGLRALERGDGRSGG
jgi:hypothetical protein